MAKGKDFYGKDVPELITRACKELSASQGDLEIEVIETGSAGIFGLCKKKAHIRVTRKDAQSVKVTDAAQGNKKSEEKTVTRKKSENKISAGKSAAKKKSISEKNEKNKKNDKQGNNKSAEKKESTQAGAKESEEKASSTSEPVRRELPSAEVIASVQEDIRQIVEKMGFPSDVKVELSDYTLKCQISGPHDEDLVGNDGRTLDSLQYLLRKMMSRRLPERMMLSLDVGNYRERRAEELKERALELANQVKEDGKTQAIAALNPSERRVVHMILQGDKSIRSRSVGEGLFKKVLIYKPGKKNKSGSRKGKGRQSGRSSGKQ